MSFLLASWILEKVSYHSTILNKKGPFNATVLWALENSQGKIWLMHWLGKYQHDASTVGGSFWNKLFFFLNLSLLLEQVSFNNPLAQWFSNMSWIIKCKVFSESFVISVGTHLHYSNTSYWLILSMAMTIHLNFYIFYSVKQTNDFATRLQRIM